MCVFISLVAIGFQDIQLFSNCNCAQNLFCPVLACHIDGVPMHSTVSLLIVDYCQTVVVFIIQYLM